MTDILTDEQIAELERLHGAATPGELRGHGHYLSHVKNKRIDYTVEHLDEIGQIVKHYPGGTYFSPYQAIPFARREDSMWLAAIHNAFPALLRRLREAERERDKACKENDFMRNLLASSNLDCVYCGLSKADMVKCESGFPGCGRADDMVFDGEVGDTEVADGGGVEKEVTDDHR